MTNAEWITKMTAAQAGKQDTNQFKEWLASLSDEEYTKVIDQYLKESYKLSDFEKKYTDNNPALPVLLNRIRTEGQQTAKISDRPVHTLRTAWSRYPTLLMLRWASAAAIILFLGIGAYLWTQNKKSDTTLA